MRNICRILSVCLTLALALSLVACSTREKDPAIATVKTFIKKAATGDKSLKDVVDFDAAADKYGMPSKELVKQQGGKEAWENSKADMVASIIETFSAVKDNYKTAFTDFKVDEKGKDYWIVSYQNPVKERRMMKVRQVDGSLRAYYYSK